MRRACLAVGLITFVVFVPCLRNGFVDWDDDHNFLDNPHYRGLGAANLRWMFTTFHAGPYQPLSWMTLGLDYVLWGMSAAGYHFTSIVLHAIAAGCFAAIVIRLAAPDSAGTGMRGGAASADAVAVGVLVGLLWGVHPLRVEAVAWITERREVLAGLLSLVAIVCHLWLRRWWLTAVVATGAMLAKGTSVVLPVLLVLIDVYQKTTNGESGLGAAGRAIVRHSAVFVIAVAMGAVAIAGQQENQTIVGFSMLGVWDRLELFLHSLGFYFVKTVWPAGLVPLYEPPRDRATLAPWALGCAAVVAVWVIAAWRTRRRNAGPLLMMLAYIAMVFPVGGAIQTGPQLAADRYSYQPGWALSLMVGAAAFWLLRGLERRRLPTLRALTLLVTAGLAWRTLVQETIWHDSRALWMHQLAIYPDTGIAHRNLGLDYVKHGRSSSDLAQAEAHFRASVARLPHFVPPILDLADLLRRTDRIGEACEWYARAAEIDPRDRAALFGLADSLWHVGRHRAALDAFSRLVAVDPKGEMSHLLRGRALAAEGHYPEAERDFEAALKTNPDSVEAMINLVSLLSSCPDDAMRDGRRAVALTVHMLGLAGAGNSRALAAGAMAYAEIGDFAHAERLMKSAMEFAPADMEPSLSGQLEHIRRRKAIRVKPEY